MATANTMPSTSGQPKLTKKGLPRKERSKEIPWNSNPGWGQALINILSEEEGILNGLWGGIGPKQRDKGGKPSKYWHAQLFDKLTSPDAFDRFTELGLEQSSGRSQAIELTEFNPFAEENKERWITSIGNFLARLKSTYQQACKELYATGGGADADGTPSGVNDFDGDACERMDAVEWTERGQGVIDKLRSKYTWWDIMHPLLRSRPNFNPVSVSNSAPGVDHVQALMSTLASTATATLDQGDGDDEDNNIALPQFTQLPHLPLDWQSEPSDPDMPIPSDWNPNHVNRSHASSDACDLNLLPIDESEAEANPQTCNPRKNPLPTPGPNAVQSTPARGSTSARGRGRSRGGARQTCESIVQQSEAIVNSIDEASKVRDHLTVAQVEYQTAKEGRKTTKEERKRMKEEKKADRKRLKLEHQIQADNLKLAHQLQAEKRVAARQLYEEHAAACSSRGDEPETFPEFLLKFSHWF